MAEEPALAAELQRLISSPDVPVSNTTSRIVGSILSAAKAAGDQRRRDAAARAQVERKRREEEAARARSEYLRDLAQRVPAAWDEIGALIDTKQPASYDRAVNLLVDLRDVAAAHMSESNFRQQVAALCAEHQRKPSLISKLRRAGLAIP